MKKARSLFIAFLLILLMVSMSASYAAESPKTVYLDGVNGNDANSGADAGHAVKTLNKAVQLLAANGGTIIVSGDTAVDAAGDSHSAAGINIVLPQHNGTIYIKGVQKSDGSYTKLIKSATGNFTTLGFGGDIVISDIKIVATLERLMLCMRGHNLTLGTNITVERGASTTNTGIWVYGFSQSAADAPSTVSAYTYNQNINIYSGSYDLITGTGASGAMRLNGNGSNPLNKVKGNIVINLYGGTIEGNYVKILSCEDSGEVEGNVAVNIYKGVSIDFSKLSLNGQSHKITGNSTLNLYNYTTAEVNTFTSRIQSGSVYTSVNSKTRTIPQFVPPFRTIPAVAEKVFHNVADYGAVGDGITDDTAAFKTAITEAGKDGLPVYVPCGQYRITDTLVLNSVTLYGYNTGAWTADNCDLPIVYHANLSKPLFDVVSGSLSGLNIEVLGVNQNTTSAAETVRITNVGGRVSDMTIRNPYIAISTAYGGNYPGNPGRCFIENIFIVQAWHTGLRVYGTFDIATLNNIEVWNHDFAHPCPTAFSFGQNDNLRAVNLFAFNAEVGFAFEQTPTGNGNQMGSCWGSFNNCSADFTETGIRVDAGNHHLTFIGGTYWTHFYALYVAAENTNAQITLSGCEIKSNGAETVVINGGSMITLSGSNITRTMSGYANACLSIGSCSAAVTVTGNTLACAGVNVTVSPAFSGAATIVGNTVVSSGTVFKSGVTGGNGIVTYLANTERGGQAFSD